MNVNDVKTKVDVKGSKFEFIINHQRSLMDKYHDIEIKSGIGYAIVDKIPFSLDDKRWQYLIKDFAWRVTEEIAEAFESYSLMQIMDVKTSRQNAWIHTVEEMIDALHFYAELMIIVGIDSDTKFSDHLGINSIGDPLEFCFRRPPPTEAKEYKIAALKAIQFLGMAMNCLKQKPWKQSQMLTDQVKFKRNLCFGFWCLIISIRFLEVQLDEIVNFYHSKNQVNQFRQRSNY